MDEIVSTYQRTREQSMRTEQVQSAIKKQRIATHTHVKSLSFDVNGNAIPLLAGFIVQVGEEDGRKGTASCRAAHYREVALSIAQELGSKVHKHGMAVGRAVDLTRFDEYEDVLSKLEEMFSIEGELTNRRALLLTCAM